MVLARTGYDAEASKLTEGLNREFARDTKVQDYVLPTLRAMQAINHKDGKQALN